MNETHLVTWENQSVSNYDIFSPTRSEDDDFSNVIRRKGFAST